MGDSNLLAEEDPTLIMKSFNRNEKLNTTLFF